MTALNEGTIDLGAPVLEATVQVTGGDSGSSEPVVAVAEEVEEEEETEDTDDEEASEVEATIEIQFDEESLETEEETAVMASIQEITQNGDKFYIIILCAIPVILLTTIAIILFRKLLTQKKQNVREIEQVREVAHKHADEKQVVEAEDQYVPNMEFDIFGLDTPSKNKKDLKNQDKDMLAVVGNHVIVED